MQHCSVTELKLVPGILTLTGKKKIRKKTLTKGEEAPGGNPTLLNESCETQRCTKVLKYDRFEKP